MSVKDAFFQKAEENAKAKKASEEALKNEIEEFRAETKALLQKIKDWFAGTSFSTELSDVSVVEDSNRFVVPSLTIRNGNKTLTIVPEGMSYIGIHGVLKATLDNPDRAPRTTDFSLHWKDVRNGFPAWAIVHGLQHTEFNQDNFFYQISSFA